MGRGEEQNVDSNAIAPRCVPRCPRSSKQPLTVGCALLRRCHIRLGTSAAGASAEPGATEEVVVTGSRLRRDTFNSLSPVQLVTREEVIAAGFSSATEALQGTAVTNGGAQINNAFGGFVTDGGPGANTLSLRGLGAGRTLVLINGRRVAPSGTRGAVGSADLNVLPNAIIDHIEMLRTAPLRSTDRTRSPASSTSSRSSNAEGLTFEAQYNSPLDGGGEQGRVSLVGGWCGRPLVVRRVARVLRPQRTHARRSRLDPVQHGHAARSRDRRVARLHRSEHRAAEVLSDHGHGLERRHDQHDRHDTRAGLPGVGAPGSSARRSIAGVRTQPSRPASPASRASAAARTISTCATRSSREC